jgi:UDP-N-acetylmuramate dehydrogenase
VTSGQILKNESLQKYTSWQVGGEAETLYQPSSIEDLALFLSSLPADEPVTWLGAGTNVLVRDQGVKGTVIVLKGTLEKLTHHYHDSPIIYAEAGVLNTHLAHFAADLELTGLEFIAGIPGTVGGALAMNAGAYGGVIWDQVVQVETINRQGERFLRKADDFIANYRQVECKVSDTSEWFIAGYFALSKGNKDTILQTMHKWLTKRKLTQPLNLPNAGSVFRNPQGDRAARLIEACGLKGYRIGGAAVSDKHANFIVNDQQATAADIEQLIAYVADEVARQTGVQLEREIKILG